MEQNIDIVVLWVDGGDPKWQEERKQFTQKTGDASEVRYRDWGLMRYWFRSIEQNMPWIRKIHFVTWGHYPPWLDLSNPKLHLVKHSDFIPKKYLPTFNANPIELNLHRIDDLSERFVYFNDDIFLTDYVNPEEVFCNGLPCATPVVNPLIPLTPGWGFGHILLNDIAFVNAHYRPKEVLKGNLSKWFSPKYGKKVLNSLYNLMCRNYFLGFTAFHEPSSMCKSTFEAVWNMEYDLLDRTCSHKFRDLEDVNQYIMTYYQLCNNQFSPRSPKLTGYFDLGNDNRTVIQAIAEKTYKFLVLNDSSDVADFESVRTELTQALGDLFPERSSFEAY